ncbi:MAG: mannose-6-phosphate isomerase-like protein (cupin superfamily) [Clostridium sp.]|jgi:mannose-6-phosphate isomerase-like protein (cupin superfamily)
MIIYKTMKGMSNINNDYNPYPYYANTPVYSPYNMYNVYKTYRCPCYVNAPMNTPTDEIEYDSRLDLPRAIKDNALMELKDYGPEPFVINIEEATNQNNTYRTALWTGGNLQVTLMSIRVGDDIGLEVHPMGDQFIRIEEGRGLVQMGDTKDNLDFQKKVYDDYAIMIPAGKWHNIINTGDKPLKLYAIYAPPEHPYGTVHETKEIAEAAEE